MRVRVVFRNAAEMLKAVQMGLFGGETHIPEKGGKRSGFHGDPTHGGKLTPTKKTTSGGVTRTYYTAPEAAPAGQATLPQTPAATPPEQPGQVAAQPTVVDPPSAPPQPEPPQAGKSVKLSPAAAGEFDMLREQHADPEGHGLDDDEREAVGHLVSHHDPKRGHLRLPDDPDVTAKMAGHVGALASSYGDQLQDKTGEASHADGRVHVKRAMGALEGLRDTLNAHEQGLRSKAAPPAPAAADTKRQEHEQKAAAHTAEAAKLPDEDPVGVKHREAAAAHESAARWHGNIGTVKGAERAAAMYSERAADRSKDVETVAQRMRARDDQRLKEDPAFQAAQTSQAARTGSPAPSLNPHNVIADKHTAQQASHTEMAAKTAGAGKTMHLDAAAAHGAAAEARRAAAGGGYSEGLAAKQASDHADQITKQTARLPQPGTPGTKDHFGHRAADAHERRATFHKEAWQAFGEGTPEGDVHRKAQRAHVAAADANKAAATGNGPEDKAQEATAKAHALSEGIEHNDPANYHRAQAAMHKKAGQTAPDLRVAGAHMKAAAAHESAVYSHTSSLRSGDKMRAASQAARDASAQAATAEATASTAGPSGPPTTGEVKRARYNQDTGHVRAYMDEAVRPHVEGGPVGNDEDSREDHRKAKLALDHYDPEGDGFRKPATAKDAHDLADTLDDYGRAETSQASDTEDRAGKVFHGRAGQKFSAHAEEMRAHAKSLESQQKAAPEADPRDAWAAKHGHLSDRIIGEWKKGQSGRIEARYKVAAGGTVGSVRGELHGQYGVHQIAENGEDGMHRVTHLPSGMAVGPPMAKEQAHTLADKLDQEHPHAAKTAKVGEPPGDAHKADLQALTKTVHSVTGGPKPMHMQTQAEATAGERHEYERRRNLGINDFHGLRGGGGKRAAGKSQGGFSKSGFARLQKEQERNSPLVAYDAIKAKEGAHKVAVRDALRSGELSPEDYQRLHGQTYGDPEALKQHKTAAEATTEARAALEKREAARKAAAAAPKPPAPRNPTLAQLHKEQGVAPDRAKKEREVWAATHKDFKDYSPDLGHTIMHAGALHPIRSMSDADLDAAHRLKVRKD